MSDVKIKLITDSASDLPSEYQNKYNVDIVPLSIHFNEEEFKDRVELSTEDFYTKMATSSKLPATSQVNPNQFVEVFEKYLAESYQILYIGISVKLSGTLQSAVIAKEMLENENIHIFDSHSATLGEGLCVIKAGELIQQGKSIQEILDALHTHRNNSAGIILLDSLNHLVRGGRLKKTQAVIGSILNIKPLLKFTSDGEVMVQEKVRSQSKALRTIIQRAKESGNDFTNKTIAVAHSNSPELAEDFIEQVKSELNPDKIITGCTGPTIGTHAGPGGVGLFY